MQIRKIIFQKPPDRDANNPAGNMGIHIVVNSCRDIKYLSTMNTNNLIIRI